MRMRVRKGLVAMLVAVSADGHGIVVVIMMPVAVGVGMLVLHGFVAMFVIVRFPGVEEYAEGHQAGAG